MHLWLGLGSQLFGWLGAISAAAALALIPLVIVRRKEPSSTIAWILTLVFVPAAGPLLFLLFGRDRIRCPAKRKRQADALVRAMVAARTGEAVPRVSVAPGDLNDLERQIFQVGALLTGGTASSGNKVDVMTEGNAVYEALGAAIDAAEHHVHAEFYLIRNDETGAWFRNKLTAAARRGV